MHCRNSSSKIFCTVTVHIISLHPAPAAGQSLHWFIHISHVDHVTFNHIICTNTTIWDTIILPLLHLVFDAVFAAHGDWMRFERATNWFWNIQSIFLGRSRELAFRVEDWGSQVDGSLTNRLLMVATVSAGEMGEVSVGKESKGGQAHILCCIIPTRVHPSLQLPPSNPSLLQVDFREKSHDVCFESSARTTNKCDLTSKDGKTPVPPQLSNFWILINSRGKLPCCPDHPWRRLTWGLFDNCLFSP